MEATTTQQQINGHDDHRPANSKNNDDLLAQLNSLHQSYDSLRSKNSAIEEDLLLAKQQRDDAINKAADLKIVVHEVSSQTDFLQDQIHEFEVSLKESEDGFTKRLEEELLRNQELEKEVNFAKDRIESLEFYIKEAERKNGFLLKTLGSIRPVKGFLVEIIECLDDEKVIERVTNDEDNAVELQALDNELKAIWEELSPITRLANEAKSKVNEFKEKKKNEKRELENSVVSLTEENRDINSLLRVALLEKEAVEKSLNKLKGNTEQKRVALLQIAERGLQRVGFGFMMGSGSTEQSPDSSSGAIITTTPAASTTASVKSDGSECEEEVVSLASTVERIMKNLRLEITQLRRSLEESRSDAERLQSLTEKQTQQVAENTLYIKELEEREAVLAQNVEELLTEIKETEAEVARWREACELEVEAGKHEIEERDKVVFIMKQELDRTKAALEISNGKLKLKEDLASAAMAAQAASEKSLQLADTRAAGLQERIEELRKQLEEAESKERSRRKVRHICWPWRTLKQNSANIANERVQSVRPMLPEMQALLHYSL
ncbi:uncharacterized protein At3g49055 isoform X1 [Ricinus communis]|uniref:ATP binding protein, putative n=1 Tax=Ricinus communis TaxID=3988 RepID=B9RIW6_RICCO|nr:uncharacterized protein At3g49055 isoform X1 [Ricinus communis]EEF49088.1 ATP binding protein, putative [Ricinus communis]|eukprot:XP_002513685.1 uncharacterized protein At3g49055 isoform X1 [Ricinus communis]